MKKVLLLVVFLIASCANPVNLRTAANYFSAGQSLIQQNKWFDGRMAFGRAWANADLGKAQDQVTAVYAYEYGRASGVICDWNEAEKGLLAALEIDNRTGGPIHMSYVELARMYQARNSNENSEKYFSLAKAALDEKQADTRDPIGYANILEAYSEVLLKLKKKSEAAQLASKAKEIKTLFGNRESRHDVTPYGKYCEQNPNIKP